MGKEQEGMPFVPEEDLDLHEDFKPIIAENGLIRQPSSPQEDHTMSTDLAGRTFTRMDTVQDLVQIRSAEEKLIDIELPPPASESAPSTQDEKLPPAQNSPSTQEEKDKPLSQQAQDVPQEQKKKGPPAPKEQDLPAIRVLKNTPKKKNKNFKLFQRKKKGKKPVDSLPPAQAVPSAKTEDTISLSREGEDVLQLETKVNKNSEQNPAVPPSLPQPVPSTQGEKTISLSPEEKDVPQGPIKGDKQQPPATPPVKPVSSHKSHRWGWALGLVCFLFFGGITGVVPVEKIPLLRHLAYAMGFTKADTARMSFLRALLTWTDKQLHFSNYLTDDSRAALLARMGDTETAQDPANIELPSMYSRAERTGGKTSLIDVGALTAMQRQKGYKPDDDVRGATQPLPGQEEESYAPLRDSEVRVRTEANQDKSDVFFGSDASAVNRNTQDGYDSSKTLAKLPNPYIVNGKPIDWMTNTAQRMMQANTGLGGLNKELSSVQVNWGGAVQDKGPQKPHRDLYHAWITSRMAKHTQNVMLKKALAEAGFWDGEIPTSASGLMFGGLQIDIDALQEDQESWDEYLKFEKQCKEALSVSTQEINQAFAAFQKIVVGGTEKLGFPANCYLALKEGDKGREIFKNNTTTTQNVCSQLDAGYKKLETACKMEISHGTVDCSSVSDGYQDMYNQFYNGCKTYYEEEKKAWEQQELAAGRTPTEENFKKDVWPNKGKEKETVDISGESVDSAFVFNKMKKDSNNFSTWIKAKKCEEDAGFCEAESSEIDKVKDTIEHHLLKI